MENQPKQYYDEELEIDLIDYLRVIWRYKKSIFVIFIAVVIIGLIVSLTIPKTYQSLALLEIGKIKGNYLESPIEIGKIIGNYLESPKDLIVLFKQEDTLKLLAQRIGLSETNWFELLKAIEIQSREKFLEIKAEAKTAKKAKDIVDAAVDLILERHQKILAKEKSFLMNEIEEIKNHLQQSENRIIETEKELNKFKNPKTEIQALLFQSFLSTLDQERENVINLRQKLLEKERELNLNYQETQVVSSAKESPRPIKPKITSNLSISVILGLLFGILYAFIAEYWQKSKSKFTV